MKSFLIILLSLSLCLLSCNAQTGSHDWRWESLDFSDAGIKIDLPCMPSKKTRIFQETPKLARMFDYNCENGNAKFSVTLSEQLGEFDQNKTKEKLDSIEAMLREGIGKNADFSSEDTPLQGSSGRIWNVLNSKTRGRHLNIQNRRGSYNVQIIFQRTENQSNENFNAEFETIAKKFLDSFKFTDPE